MITLYTLIISLFANAMCLSVYRDANNGPLKYTKRSLKSNELPWNNEQFSLQLHSGKVLSRTQRDNIYELPEENDPNSVRNSTNEENNNIDQTMEQSINIPTQEEIHNTITMDQPSVLLDNSNDPTIPVQQDFKSQNYIFNQLPQQLSSSIVGGQFYQSGPMELNVYSPQDGNINDPYYSVGVNPNSFQSNPSYSPEKGVNPILQVEGNSFSPAEYQNNYDFQLNTLSHADYNQPNSQNAYHPSDGIPQTVPQSIKNSFNYVGYNPSQSMNFPNLPQWGNINPNNPVPPNFQNSVQLGGSNPYQKMPPNFSYYPPSMSFQNNGFNQDPQTFQNVPPMLNDNANTGFNPNQQVVPYFSNLPQPGNFNPNYPGNFIKVGGNYHYPQIPSNFPISSPSMQFPINNPGQQGPQEFQNYPQIVNTNPNQPVPPNIQNIISLQGNNPIQNTSEDIQNFPEMYNTGPSQVVPPNIQNSIPLESNDPSQSVSQDFQNFPQISNADKTVQNSIPLESNDPSQPQNNQNFLQTMNTNSNQTDILNIPNSILLQNNNPSQILPLDNVPGMLNINSNQIPAQNIENVMPAEGVSSNQPEYSQNILNQQQIVPQNHVNPPQNIQDYNADNSQAVCNENEILIPDINCQRVCDEKGVFLEKTCPKPTAYSTRGCSCAPKYCRYAGGNDKCQIIKYVKPSGWPWQNNWPSFFAN